MSMTSRRAFLRTAAAFTVGFRGLQTLLADGAFDAAALEVAAAGYGPLEPDPEGILDLPRGFSYDIISRVGEQMADGLLVPGKPDGMAAFPGPDGRTLLVRNHELQTDWVKLSPYGRDNALLTRIARDRVYDAGHGSTPCLGGTTTLVYDTRARRLEKQFLSLAGTEYNCAGGPTPWSTWISCEETVRRAGDVHEKDHGYNFEVPAAVLSAPVTPVPLKAMGRFQHEAVAVDPATGIVYQTEDRNDGVITRFIPRTPGRLLDGGRLQALVVLDRRSLDTRNWLEDGKPLGPTIAPRTRLPVTWMDLEEIENPLDDLRRRAFEAGAACFARAEGMWYGHDSVYFACTNGGRARCGQIWRYVPGPAERTAAPGEPAGELELFIEPNDPAIIDHADNLTVAPWGDLVICEDGPGEQFLVGVTPEGECYRLARNAHCKSEFAGSTFSPDGGTLFVNLQDAGLTLAIRGPWRRGA